MFCPLQDEQLKMLVSHYGQNDWKFLASHFPVSDPMPSWESQCLHVAASPCAGSLCLCSGTLCSDFIAPSCEMGLLQGREPFLHRGLSMVSLLELG